VKLSLIAPLILVSGLVFGQTDKPAKEAQLDFDVGYPTYLKTTHKDPTDADVTNYVHDYSFMEWKNKRDNDFDWHDILAKYRTEIVTKRDAVDLTQEYVLHVAEKYGSYDFNRGGFPLSFDHGSYYAFDSPMAGSTLYRPFMPRVTLFMENAEDYRFLKMDQDSAKAILKNGYAVDSENKAFKIFLHFKILDSSDPEYQAFVGKDTYNEYFLLGKLDKVEIEIKGKSLFNKEQKMLILQPDTQEKQ